MPLLNGDWKQWVGSLSAEIPPLNGAAAMSLRSARRGRRPRHAGRVCSQTLIPRSARAPARSGTRLASRIRHDRRLDAFTLTGTICCEESGHARIAAQAGSVLGRDWPKKSAIRKAGDSGSVCERGDTNSANDAAIPLGENAARKAEISAQSQLWSQDFTAKLFCNVEFWVERLAKLIEPQAEFRKTVAAGARLQPVFGQEVELV